MFVANLKGELRKLIGRDIHGRHLLGPSVPCPFGAISLQIGALPTTVRADSSASRGSSNELVTQRGRILIPSFIKVDNNDIFGFQGVKYKVVSVHPRYSIAGYHDHWECDLESYLG